MKSTCFAVLFFIAGPFLHRAAAQEKSAAIQRCATMDRLRLYEANNNALKTATEAKARRVMSGPDSRSYRLQGLVTIPVAVHIVLPNPYIVTDADVQVQIDRLNQDFSGLNADSTNAFSFYSVRGHSQIRFCLARRTPAGELTTGIERRASLTGSKPISTIDPIKRTSLGGLDSWNTAQYLNLWIGMDATGQEILGYADNVGPSNTSDDGVFLNMQSFGTSSCYTSPKYNKGRTATHEVGHYLGLYHIWGDDDGGCTGDDFEQLPATTTYSLPNGLFNPSGQGNGAGDVGDTPNQGDATMTCPSGAVTDDCAATAPGKMYQNHMDYTQDACLSMFTKQQVARMEWVLENARSGLLTSKGCQPPASAALLDAAPLAPVNPGGFELSGCQTIYYTDTLSCPGNMTPKLRVVNNGMNPITSLTAGYRYDNSLPVSKIISLNLLPGGTAVISFDPIAVSTGTHSLHFFTASPNGEADQLPANDNYTQSFTVMAPVFPPMSEGLETELPVDSWTTDNPDFDFTWQRTGPGRAGSAGKLSINNFDTDGTGNKDDFRSTTITVDPASSYVLTFDLAHKQYPDDLYSDTLAVLVSTDCGQTFSRVYYKGGEMLATAGSSEEEYTDPAETDWRSESVNLNGPVLASGKIVILFRNISGYGNWIHLDNINLVKLGARDLQVVSVQQPTNFVCASAVTPSVTVRNNGTDIVQSFNISYTINNGTAVSKTFTGLSLAKDDEATVNLPAFSGPAPGNYTFRVYASDLVTSGGTGDANQKNDSLKIFFSVPGTVSAPLEETFTNAAFPSNGWSVLNSDNLSTWQPYPAGNGNRGAAFFNTYNYFAKGEVDQLVSPLIGFGPVDSVRLNFDLAAANVGGTFTAMDTLEVLVTADCGNSFTTVYKKWGANLQTLRTANPAGTEFFPRGSADWRSESIDISAFADKAPIVVFFRATNNNENNIFLDNISVKTRILPTALKQQGYLLYPSPFRTNFMVWHYQAPTDLASIRVMNLAGQMLWAKRFNGNAAKQEAVDFTGKPAGIYLVEISYTGDKKLVVQKIVKE